MSLSEKVWTTSDIVDKSQCFKLKGTEEWVRVENAQRVIDEKELTITALRNTLERERGEQKQKQQQVCDEIRSKLKFLDYEQYHGDLKQSLNPTLRQINLLIEELLRK